MKKYTVLVTSVFILSLFVFFGDVSFADCEYAENSSISDALDGCLAWADLVNPDGGKIEIGIKNKIVYWTTQLAKLFWLLAVGAIVYGGLMMTLSWWEDEKIKKWKDIVKWAMLWFLWLMAAGWIIRIIVEVMFSVAS